MSFVVSAGQLTGLDRAMAPSRGSVQITEWLTQDYASLWRTQPQLRTVVDFLARNIAQLGLHTYERVDDLDRRRLTDHPLPRLLARPNPQTTRYRMFDGLVHDLGIYDTAYWLKTRLDRSTVGLLRLPPDRVTPDGDSWIAADGYILRGSRGKKRFSADQVVCFRGYNPIDGRIGVSPIETLRRVLAEEFQANLYRENLWRNGARFSGYLKRPKEAPSWSDGARERFKEGWRSQYAAGGSQPGGTPILEDGMEFVAAGVTPEQAQYLEARKLTREEVAAAYHIPLPMVGILDHATFSNITEQHKQLYQDTLGPWLQMIQEEIELQLLPDLDSTGRVYVEFNMAEKLRGSFEEQAEQLASAVGGPYMLRNEARARLNLPQLDDGNELIVPLNVSTGSTADDTTAVTEAAEEA